MPVTSSTSAKDRRPSLNHRVAAAPFCAYLFVANVFIYLNLRYEYSLRR